jgi:hypothetical protein
MPTEYPPKYWSASMEAFRVQVFEAVVRATVGDGGFPAISGWLGVVVSLHAPRANMLIVASG